MEWIGTKEVLTEWIKKYRLALWVLLAGLVFLLVPEQKEQVSTAVVQTATEEPTLQQELETILSRLEGAGKVQVLLTRSSGEEIHYQTDEDIRQDESGKDHQVKTVLITGSDRNETGLVQRIDPPVYLGAVVLCQGADSAAVRLAVVDAVKTATGLSSDRISVLKMK